METPILERVRTGLLEKRVGLTEWLRKTPPLKKGVLLGPSTEQAVHTHLSDIDNSITEAESGTLGLCEVCQDYVETDLLEIDYMACVCISHFSEEEVRHLENELELAQSVQKALLPQEVPIIPSLEIAAFSRPAPIVWLNPTGAAIGLVEEAEFGEKTLSLREGDLLVMYTDGVTEAVDPQNEEFGSERLVAMIEQLYQSTPKEVVRGIREGLENFCGGQPLADDTTVLVCRIT